MVNLRGAVPNMNGGGPLMDGDVLALVDGGVDAHYQVGVEGTHAYLLKTAFQARAKGRSGRVA